MVYQLSTVARYVIYRSVYLSWVVVAGANMYAIEKRMKGTEEWRKDDYLGGRSAVLKNLESKVIIEFKVLANHNSGIKSNWSKPVQVLVL